MISWAASKYIQRCEDPVQGKFWPDLEDEMIQDDREEPDEGPYEDGEEEDGEEEDEEEDV